MCNSWGYLISKRNFEVNNFFDFNKIYERGQFDPPPMPDRVKFRLLIAHNIHLSISHYISIYKFLTNICIMFMIQCTETHHQQGHDSILPNFVWNIIFENK